MLQYCQGVCGIFFDNIGEKIIMEQNEGLIGLRLIRKQKKYTQLKVAMALNISREALSHYENGKRSPDVEMLLKLSAYFNVSIHFLITGKEFHEQ